MAIELCLKWGETMLLKDLDGSYQRCCDLQQGFSRVDVRQQFLQPCRWRGKAGACARADVDSYAHHDIPAAAEAGRFDQNPGQLAPLPPEIVRPFQLQIRVQALNNAQTHSQRQAGPIVRCQGQAKGKREITGPLASEATPASALLLGQ